MAIYVTEICLKEDFQSWAYPGVGKDTLFNADYLHKYHDPGVCVECAASGDAVCNRVRDSSCAELQCLNDMTVTRSRITQAPALSPAAEEPTKILSPRVHFGTVATADLVMKSGRHRDMIAAEDHVIAFEMEGAGVWDNFPTIIIKGVCDYADSHKNKGWQKYSAVTAAACMKAFLGSWACADNRSNMG